MSWSPKIILAANFYGSYLHSEDFDDSVIISDGGVDRLIEAAETRVSIFSKLTDKEADIYVFCVIGITDMLKKTLMNNKYLLTPNSDALLHMEVRMDNAMRRLEKYRAKIIWTTTYPISLSKYHRSQGWNINEMQQYGFSQNMELEQQQLFMMCESLMDLCHSYNKRVGQQDFFLIRKVYFSHDGQRELLTHNLLEDGINPGPSVTAEWNRELSKYLQTIRKSAYTDSSVPSLLGQSLQLPAEPMLAVESGATLFNYGGASSAYSEREINRKRAGQYQQQEEIAKKPRMEDALMEKLGSQPEGMQKKLAMGMLKFITENIGEDAFDLTKAAARGPLLDRPAPKSNKHTNMKVELSNAPNYPQSRPSDVNMDYQRSVTFGSKPSMPLDYNHGQTEKSGGIQPLMQPMRKPLITNGSHTSASKANRKSDSGPIIQPRSVKDRLNMSHDPLPNSARAPLLVTPAAMQRKSARDRLNLGTPSEMADFESSRRIYAAPLMDHPGPGSRPTDDLHVKRDVQFRYGAPQPLLPNPEYRGQQDRPMRPLGASRPYDGRNLHLDELTNMPRGLPNMLKGILVGDEAIVKRDGHGIRDDYVLMAVKTSTNAPKFSRIMAAHGDGSTTEKIGEVKIGSQKFFAFKKGPGGSEELPTVSFLKTNQWLPGFERTHAPMTVLQKEVAAYNLTVYQLLKRRTNLKNRLKKNKDSSIRMIRSEPAVDKSENGKLKAVAREEEITLAKTEQKTNAGEQTESAADNHATEGDQQTAAAQSAADDWEDLDDTTDVVIIGSMEGDGDASVEEKDAKLPDEAKDVVKDSIVSKGDEDVADKAADSEDVAASTA